MGVKKYINNKLFLVVLGICVSLFGLEISLHLGGSIVLSIREHKNSEALREKDSIRIVCLGGSTTADGGDSSYPSQLEDVLNERSNGLKFKVINGGIDSIDSTFILSSLEENIEKYNPDIIIVMMGINDNPNIIAPCERRNFIIKKLKIFKLINLIYLHMIDKINNLKNDTVKTKHLFKVIDEIYNDSINVTENKFSEFLNYKSNKNYEKAENIISNLIKDDLNNVNFLVNLGDMYVVQERFQEAEVVLLKALYVNPEDVAVYPILGFCYNQWSKYDLAENILEKGISLNRKDPRMYLELYHSYKAQGKIEESLKLCDYIEKHNSKSEHFLAIVAAIYRELGRDKGYNLYLEKINKIRFCHYNPIIKDNYLKLKNIILNRGIKLICVQYPMRNVEHLRNIFNSTEGVIFVDNEEVFKKAVSCSSYEDYFRDIFAGDFGHCTKEGNKLLADNIADSLLSNCFKY